MTKLFSRIKRYAKRIIKVIFRPEMRILPGQIAFFLVLALIPLVTLVALVASKFSIPLTEFISGLSHNLPKEIADLIAPILSSPGTSSLFSIILGFYIASNGTKSIIVASNMLFKIDDKDFIKRRVKALIMLVIIVFLFLFMLVVLGYGNTIFELVINYFNLELPESVMVIYNLIRFVAGIFVIYILVNLILTLAPSKRISSRKMSKGALLVTISWVVITFVYSIYVSNFANYNILYSSLANLVILMIWIYLISYTLVVGIAINSENYLYESKLEEEKEELANV